MTTRVTHRITQIWGVDDQKAQHSQTWIMIFQTWILYGHDMPISSNASKVGIFDKMISQYNFLQTYYTAKNSVNLAYPDQVWNNSTPIRKPTNPEMNLIVLHSAASCFDVGCDID